ncbi:hypothetical protein [Stappia sp.]|uniref:hypothetical protein n=1 Tax=Stappia sp. TaxID=1870903 RepID=UPI003C7A1770
MKNFTLIFFALLFITTDSIPVISQKKFDPCDSVIELERGEKPKNSISGFGYLIGMHFLSEKYCKSTVQPLGPAIEAGLIHAACGPETQVYKDTMAAVENARVSTLSGFLTEKPHDRSHDEEEARETVKRIVDEFGGCQKLTKAVKDSFNDLTN